jgi:ribosomal protein S18 acetylase RimI-like enzyme
MVQIKEINDNAGLKEFIRFPDSLYKGNIYRVTPLHSIEKGLLDRNINPAFEYCLTRYWMAFRDGKPVGRIAAILNTASNKLRKEKFMRFGWIDFIDDIEVSSALMRTVEEWALQQGMTHVHGPLGFTDMDLEGMLIEGFNEIATHAVLYNYPYYPEHLKTLGYGKEVDWVQFEIKVPKAVPDKIIRIANIVKEKYNLRILRAKRTKELLPYVDKMFATLNESFINLYGFVPLTPKQIEYYTKQYFSIINPKYVCFIIDEDDEVAGFAIAILSLSKALIKAQGELFPFGFMHVLKALYKNDTIDLFLLGVKPGYKNKGLPAIFFAEIMRSCINSGVKTAISSHALETNTAAYIMFREYEHRQHLRRRCFSKSLNARPKVDSLNEAISTEEAIANE